MATFNTNTLKKLVSIAIQGAGLNEKIDLSKDMGISVSDNMLYLNTTDGTNYLSVSDKCEADDFDITVDAETFAKLVGKINSDEIELEVDEKSLTIKGNGKYTLELITDDSGELLSFPDVFPETHTQLATLSVEDLITINSALKASLSKITDSVYSSYYFGDMIASTDRFMLSSLSKKIFDKPYILSREFVDLMCLSDSDVYVSIYEDKMVSESYLGETTSIDVCTKISDKADEFNITGITAFLNMEESSFCRFRKAQMLDLLDRMSLFVDKFDDGAIELFFTDTFIQVSSMSSTGVERIEFTESKDTKDITIKINIDRLRNQLKAYNSDIVDLYYGNDMCIKLVDGDLTQIIALIR